jgi:gamma-glutamylcyclotransferase (GGCT)/AIG2-like uncharacterized protein YtfP
MSGARHSRVHEIPADQRDGLALFAYGTLTFGPVVEALLGRRPPTSPAVAPGWRAARLPGRPYPGLVPAADRQAAGVLLIGLTPAEWALLDAWEGDPYQVRRVRTAAAEPGGATPEAFALTYTWRAVDDTEPADWDPAHFAAEWLDRYLARLHGAALADPAGG